MRVTAIGIERHVITQTLRFLNVRTITKPQHVVQTFDGLMYVRAEDPLGLTAPPFLSGAAYRELQEVIRYALDAIVARDGDRMRRVKALADYELARVTFVPRPAPRVRGEFDLVIVPDNVDTCCWLAVLFLLDSARPYRRRLGRCGAPGCEHFNLTFEGRPQRHCSPEHRRRYDETKVAARVKAWRARKRRERAAAARR